MKKRSSIVMAKKSEFFALSNPISVVSGKEKEDITRNDLINIIHSKEIERITFHYTGIDGKIKELKIPITSRKQAELILSDGERVDGSSLFKGMVEVGKSDLYIVPKYKTAFLNPFDKGSLDFMCRFFDRDGNLATFAPDNILTNAHKMLFRNHDLKLEALGEIEFYLLGNMSNPTYLLPKQKGYHAASPFAKSGEMISEMIKLLSQITGSVKYAHNEVGYLEKVESDFTEINGKSAEQVEIEFLLSDIEDAGDYVVLGSWIIRNVAYKHGHVATFFPKLEPGHAGNGFHIHMALTKNGKNVMCRKDGKLNDNSMKLIGGLCRYAPSLTAFGNMVSASYLRLVPGQEAPTRVCWSDSNRSALIRVPLAWTNVNNLAQVINPQQKEKSIFDSSRQTVELRTPDGSANVHLLLAGIAMAADWGLTNSKESLDLAAISKANTIVENCKSSGEIGELSTSCAESAEKLLSARQMYERSGIFPPNVINYISKLLMAENDRYINNRLLSLPEEERLIESRRIMHRDIHRC